MTHPTYTDSGQLVAQGNEYDCHYVITMRTIGRFSKWEGDVISVSSAISAAYTLSLLDRNVLLRLATGELVEITYFGGSPDGRFNINSPMPGA